MGKFDEIIDEFVFMAKNAADVAGKKTGEVVEIGKLRYQLKQVEWDLEKSYAKLGAIFYESKHSNEDFSEAILLSTSEIDDLKLKMSHIEDSLRAYRKVKKCAKCDLDNDSGAAFCARCGSPLEDAPIDIAPETPPETEDSAEN